jgi:hypothetical protein
MATGAAAVFLDETQACLAAGQASSSNVEMLIVKVQPQDCAICLVEGQWPQGARAASANNGVVTFSGSLVQ